MKKISEGGTGRDRTGAEEERGVLSYKGKV